MCVAVLGRDALCIKALLESTILKSTRDSRGYLFEDVIFSRLVSASKLSKGFRVGLKALELSFIRFEICWVTADIGLTGAHGALDSYILSKALLMLLQVLASCYLLRPENDC